MPQISAICFVIAYLILGREVLLTALKNMKTGHVMDENFLMSIATIGAFCVDQFGEAVGVMLFYRVGETFEHRAVEKSRVRSWKPLIFVRRPFFLTKTVLSARFRPVPLLSAIS